MEMRAYLEGIAHHWWLVGALVLVGFLGGRSAVGLLPAHYTASSTVLVNEALLGSAAAPTTAVQLAAPDSYVGLVTTPTVLATITQHYPRLPANALLKEIVVSMDSADQVIVINVSDKSAAAAADIARYLAQQFVASQQASLNQQLTYYQTTLQQEIGSLGDEINQDNLRIQQLTPPPTRSGPAYVPPATQAMIAQDQGIVDRDERQLYDDQRALLDVQNAQPLFANAYQIVQPATTAHELVDTPLPAALIELIGLVIGLLLAIVLSIALDYFLPVVRHGGEIERIAGLALLAEAPRLFSFERARLLEQRPPLVRGRIEQVRALGAALAAPALGGQRQIILLTSAHRRQHLGPTLALLLARAGYETLLVDADFARPTPEPAFARAGACKKVARSNLALTFIGETAHQHLYTLPVDARPAGGESLSPTMLGVLLPQLASSFDVVLVDAPPLTSAEARLLAKQVNQVVVLVRKRRDSFQALDAVRTFATQMQLEPNCVLVHA